MAWSLAKLLDVAEFLLGLSQEAERRKQLPILRILLSFFGSGFFWSELDINHGTETVGGTTDVKPGATIFTLNSQVVTHLPPDSESSPQR